MNTDRPSTRARGTVEFQGGPYDGLVLVCAHLEKMVLAIEIVRLEDGTHMMRQLLDVSEAGARQSGYYQLSPRPEGGDGAFHWQGGKCRPSGLG